MIQDGNQNNVKEAGDEKWSFLFQLNVTSKITPEIFRHDRF